MTKEKPETFLELLPVAILNQNFEIVKYMVEKFKITEADTPSMNALSFVNSIYPDNSKNKINEPKDNYLLIQSPFILICGIGGNIEIYKFLLNNKLISDKKQVGFIGLSKKYKNLVYSNVVGACAYYGKHEILEFILKAPKNELDVNNINIPTTEKKSKNNSRLFVKEFTGLTPCMLAIVGPCSDLQTIDVLKKLINYHAKFDALDLNKDNLLHLATKNKKIETAKYLIDELNLKNLLNETNKEGQTPLSLAQHLKDKVFISYYNEKTGVDEKEIEENLKELINESNKSNKNNNKKKKNKKNKNNDTVTLLNTTEYQESLKVDNTSEKNYSSTYSNTNSKNTYNSSNNRIKLHALLDNPKPKKKKEKQEIKVEKEEKKVESNGSSPRSNAARPAGLATTILPAGCTTPRAAAQRPSTSTRDNRLRIFPAKPQQYQRRKMTIPDGYSARILSISTLSASTPASPTTPPMPYAWMLNAAIPSPAARPFTNLTLETRPTHDTGAVESVGWAMPMSYRLMEYTPPSGLTVALNRYQWSFKIDDASQIGTAVSVPLTSAYTTGFIPARDQGQ